jgi:2-C-methyl-D-erythritol 4-phosphate cytidylyltransferase
VTQAAAIIVAAGRGKRFSGPIPKQFLPLAGRPILSHTLHQFAASPSVDTIWLVVAESDFSYCRQHILTQRSLGVPVRLVAGGSERQHSVYNALQVLPKRRQLVVIHDGVRPLVSTALIEACIQTADAYGACVVGMPAHETIKQADRSNHIACTLNRENIWLVQTPQAFRYELIAQAHRQARQDDFQGTDDAVLVERLGHPVKIIAGSKRNLKITTREDLIMAEALYHLGNESAATADG